MTNDIITTRRTKMMAAATSLRLPSESLRALVLARATVSRYLFLKLMSVSGRSRPAAGLVILVGLHDLLHDLVPDDVARVQEGERHALDLLQYVADDLEPGLGLLGQVHL